MKNRHDYQQQRQHQQHNNSSMMESVETMGTIEHQFSAADMSFNTCSSLFSNMGGGGSSNFLNSTVSIFGSGSGSGIEGNNCTSGLNQNQDILTATVNDNNNKLENRVEEGKGKDNERISTTLDIDDKHDESCFIESIRRDVLTE